MDKSSNNSNGSPEATSLPPLSRESTASTATITPKTDSWPSKLTSQTSGTSTSSSAAPSREPSPTRPISRTNVSRASSTTPGTRSRKNSLHDVSPSRVGRPLNPALTSVAKTLSSATTPTLLPVTSDANIGAPVKSPTSQEHLRESPRWPVSPRLRSPPPILHKPNLAPPRRGEQDLPAINLQRATPPQPTAEVQSDTDNDDAYLPSGVRTPARGAGGSAPTLETVQEVSPLGSPRTHEESMEEKLEDSFVSETSQPDASDFYAVRALGGKAGVVMNESGSESGSIKASRRSGPRGTAPPLTTRQSSSSVKPAAAKGKTTGEISLQNMTVETETVISIPQVAVAPSGSKESTAGTLRQKPSTETIRPKKEKKKSRKQPTVASGTGEHIPLFQPRVRHHRTIRLVSSAHEMRISPRNTTVTMMTLRASGLVFRAGEGRVSSCYL